MPKDLTPVTVDAPVNGIDMSTLTPEDLRLLLRDVRDEEHELVDLGHWVPGLKLEARSLTVEKKAVYMRALARTAKAGSVDFASVTLGLIKASIFIPAFADGKWEPGKSTVLALAHVPDRELMKRSAKMLESLSDVVSRLSGVTQEEMVPTDEDEEVDDV